MPAEGVDAPEVPHRQVRQPRAFAADRPAHHRDRRDASALEFHLDKLTRTPNTVNAHRLIRFAGQKGVQDAVVEALFEAYFCNGADIGDDKVLAEHRPSTAASITTRCSPCWRATRA